MRTLYAVTLSAVLLLLGGEAPQHSRDDALNKRLNELSRVGVTHRFLDENTIELRDTLEGWTRVKTLKEPDEATVRDWAATRNIPVIDIDPTLVDTSKWAGWYDFWTVVPIGNSARVRTQVRDFDGNGFPEVYGCFGWIASPGNRAFEVYPDGSSLERYQYNSLGPAYSTHIVDVDHNGLWEVVFQRSGINYFFEQPTAASLPTELKFAFNKYNPNAAYLSIEHIAEMDGDSLIDFVHRGTDSTVSPHDLVYVSEYYPPQTNFRKTWWVELPWTDDFWDGYDIGDYDGDGRMEFIASSLRGKVWVVENTGDNSYAVTFRDSLPWVNMYYQTSGDVDNDGRREFFIGATMGSGNWTVMYEADSNNHYSPRFIFHLMSGGSLDDPTYFTDDVNNDGKVELLILSGGYLYVFASNTDDTYYLWYLKEGPSSISLNLADLNGDGIKDILWTKVQDNQYVSNVYKASPLVGVHLGGPTLPERVELMQNYPNPFNPSTTIEYSLPRRGYVRLTIYDMIGREIVKLVDDVREAGAHEVRWNGSSLASGVYLYELRTSGSAITRKMLLVK
jgi:hypothetical protein